VFPPISKQTWAATFELLAVELELVLRSILTLKALAHHDTGAIITTATNGSIRGTDNMSWKSQIRAWPAPCYAPRYSHTAGRESPSVEVEETTP
jgi:hypothetical protein